MTQGNPFGAKGGRWMPTAKLRALAHAKRTYDEIAEANFRSEGWKPSRSAVLRKLESLGIERRYPSHTNLIPWRVAPEHNRSVIRHMLQAESRKRQHKALSETDRKLLSRLDEMLFGRGTPMVVTYHPDTGFALVMREDDDEDIIRVPSSPEGMRKEIQAALRDCVAEDYDAETAQRILRAIAGSPEDEEEDDHLKRA